MTAGAPAVRVQVPATSANLGPGFDALGVALDRWDDVDLRVAPDGSARVEVTGEGAGVVPRDATHLVYRCAHRALIELDVHPGALHLRCRNTIPHGRGLGSSSAAIVGGLAAGRALAHALTDGASSMTQDELFSLAAEIEGHPDNVAPAAYGGLQVAYRDGDRFRSVAAPVAGPGGNPMEALVLVPADAVPTELARGLLPASVSHADAAFNVGRVALLLLGLQGRPELLMAATEDRLHQEYRSGVMGESTALLRELRAQGHPATISGAGPTLLVLPGESGLPATERLPLPPRWRRWRVGLAGAGVREIAAPGESLR